MPYDSITAVVRSAGFEREYWNAQLRKNCGVRQSNRYSERVRWFHTSLRQHSRSACLYA